MEDIRGNLNKINEEIKLCAERCGRNAEDVLLCAVSKTRTPEEINIAIDAGVTDIGENKVQEIMDKFDAVKPVKWHMIGHLQTNKLKMVLPYVSLVQSVDSVRLLDAINAWGTANGKVIDVLLEPHVAAEETKQGFSADEIMKIPAAADQYGSIRFRGIMGMATFTDDEAVIRSDFAALRAIYDQASSLFPDMPDGFDQFSIGMSDDYPLAIEYGSTMVRIGSMIFGARQ